jgi:pantothenate kinase
VPVVRNLQPYIERAAGLRDADRRSLLAIGGPPGSGKTTLALRVVEALNKGRRNANTAAFVPMDGFYLADDALTRQGLLDRKGAPETFDAEGYVDLLRDLLQRPDEERRAPGFDRIAEATVPGEHVVAPSVRLVVTEGNYVLLRVGEWAAIRPMCAETWFLGVEPDVERKRLVRHRMEKGLSSSEAIQWVERSDLANAELVRAYSAPGTCFLMLEEGAL